MPIVRPRLRNSRTRPTIIGDLPAPGAPVDRYHLFRGSFPERSGVAAPLGTRGPAPSDAYDHEDVDCTLTDHFEDGIPLIPLVGFWMRL